MKSQTAKLERTKFFIKYFCEKYQPKCHLCGKAMDWKEFYPTKKVMDMNELKTFNKHNDNWVEHHLDCNHDNNDINNRVLVHKSCHKKYHIQLENQIVVGETI